MAKTGWCRECGKWVETESDGACPKGHGPECIDALHSSDPGSAASQGVGVGEMPASFQRFGWGAYFLMPIWGVVYGSNAVLGWWLLSLLATFVIVSLAAGVTEPAAIAAVSSASSVVQIAIHLWVGMNAYRWLWKREQMRLALVPDAHPRFSVSTFMAKQVRWLVAGATLTVLSVLGLAFLLTGDPNAQAVREQLGVTPTEIMSAAVWTFAEVAFAVWLAGRMRRGEADDDVLDQTA